MLLILGSSPLSFRFASTKTQKPGEASGIGIIGMDGAGGLRVTAVLAV